MFRRFMIVSWALFSVSALIAIVALGTYYYFENRGDGLSATFAEEHRNLRADGDAASNAGEDLTIEQIEASILSENDWVKFRQKSFRRKGEPALEVSHFGATGAGILLLWILTWHIGHWVWMGRHDVDKAD